MEDVIVPAQSRAARGLLNRSWERPAEVCGVPARTVAEFELGNTVPRALTSRKLIAAVEAAGVEFTNGNAPGVRLRNVATHDDGG